MGSQLKFASSLIFLAVLLVFSFAHAADEPDTRSPLERYKGDGDYSVLICKLSLRMALLHAEGGTPQDDKSDFATCIANGKATAKQNLSKALRTVKKAKAQDALKSYHVVLIAALSGIAPGVDERKISYEQRQQAFEDRLNEAWARFETEQ